MEVWIENLKQHWLNKDVDKIIDLFEKSVLYYETPFDIIENIKKVWDEIEEQNIIEIEYKILNSNENKATVNYILKLSNNEIYDMVYYIELNEKNKCTYFKQWFMSKEGD